MSKIKTYVFIALDASGSMDEIKAETIEKFNRQIKTLKSAQTKKMETFVSLFTFNDSLNEIFFNVSLNDVPTLTEENYKTGGFTSIFDSLNNILVKSEDISDINDKNVSCLFFMLSDGRENSSENSSKDLASKIKKLQDSGRWTFAYAGANQDLTKISSELNIPKGNILKYDSYSLGFNAMTENHTKSLGYFFTARSYGTPSTKGFYGSDAE